jgi:hypothetical protein
MHFFSWFVIFILFETRIRWHGFDSLSLCPKRNTKAQDCHRQRYEVLRGLRRRKIKPTEKTENKPSKEKKNQDNAKKQNDLTCSTQSRLSQSLNMFMTSGVLILSRVYPKLIWSRDVNRSTSLNHRHEKRFTSGVCSRTMKQPSGTSGQERTGG